MIKISNLSFFYNNFKALDIENLEIETDKVVALLGFNGSGKSTLLRLISNLIKPNSGSIEIWGKNTLSLKELKDIAILLPEPALLKRIVRENFKFALKSRGNLENFNSIVPEVLELVGLNESFLDKKHFELSSGQNKRIAFALVLSLRAKLNLLDEPTNAIDLATAKLFSSAINYTKDQYKQGFIIATHDEKWISVIADKSFFLHNGKIASFELKNIFLSNSGVLEFKNLSINLPQNLKNSTKIAINPNLIKLSLNPINGYYKGILHSLSLTYNDKFLVKISLGDMLIKCIASSKEGLEFAVGREIYFYIDENAFLSLD